MMIFIEFLQSEFSLQVTDISSIGFKTLSSLSLAATAKIPETVG